MGCWMGAGEDAEEERVDCQGGKEGELRVGDGGHAIEIVEEEEKKVRSMRWV